jgi:hypothetical protein
MPTNLPPRRPPPKSGALILLVWDAGLAIAAAIVITEMIASVRWAFS